MSSQEMEIAAPTKREVPQQGSGTVERTSMDINEKRGDITPHHQDAFGDEEFAEVKYKVLTEQALLDDAHHWLPRLVGSVDCLWSQKQAL
jgi:hypothetical protein